MAKSGRQSFGQSTFRLETGGKLGRNISSVPFILVSKTPSRLGRIECAGEKTVIASPKRPE
jgi:hypothetical protein